MNPMPACLLRPTLMMGYELTHSTVQVYLIRIFFQKAAKKFARFLLDEKRKNRKNIFTRLHNLWPQAQTTQL